MGNSWRVLEQDPKEIKKLANSYNLDPLLAKCLLNRQVAQNGEVEPFLEPSCYLPPDPFLMPDMDLAVERVLDAIRKKERVCIYGDYDADGVTAIAILTQALRELGCDVFYYIPDRFFEGVGLNSERLGLLKQDGVGLVITVDTGVRAFEEMELARKIGLDVIITDHHTPDEQRPDAIAVLNPKIRGSQYPFDGLSGAGVALKLVQALAWKNPGAIDLKKYLKIAAIGTIADMVPLRGENRWIVWEGLKEIDKEEQGPIRGLLRKVGIRGRVNALDISFKVAPRINAPGRLGDPDTAIAFFECKSPREISHITDIMDGMNTVRQNLEKELEAKLELQIKHSYRRRKPPFILVAGRHWHRGILGIMACKMLRRFSRPACVLSFDSEKAHGSIRGLPGLDILKPLDEISSLLTSYGGHPEAAGISLPVTNVPQFKSRMIELLAPQLAAYDGNPGFSIDAEIDWQDLNSELIDNLYKMAPFGIGNSAPVFFSANLILESEPSRKGQWYHFEVSDGCISRKCSFYHPIGLAHSFERYDSIDLVYSLTPFRDEYQVQVVEMRPSQS